MITYIEKGYGLHDEILRLGHKLVKRHNADGTKSWISSDDIVVQAIIDGYDPLPDYKAAKKAELKAEALRRMQIVFPAFQTMDDVKFFAEFWQSIKPAARQATPNFQKIIDIYAVAKSTLTTISTMSNESDIKNYDVISTPSWPT